MATQEEWKAAVEAAYAANVSAEEFKNKCTSNPDATRKIAYYFKSTGYDIIDIDAENGRLEVLELIQTLYDFLSFTDGI